MTDFFDIENLFPWAYLDPVTREQFHGHVLGSNSWSHGSLAVSTIQYAAIRPRLEPFSRITVRVSCIAVNNPASLGGSGFMKAVGRLSLGMFTLLNNVGAMKVVGRLVLKTSTSLNGSTTLTANAVAV